MNTEKRLLECEVSRLSGLLEILRSDFKEIADALGCDVKDNEAMLEKIAELNAGHVTGWIKCSDRMPQPVMPMSEEQSKKLFDEWSGGDGAYGIVPIRQDVTHWMPLPAAPEQEV